MDLSYHIYDVFTKTPFSGNPLAIVTEADALTTAQMQTIAREFNLSETIFVMAPRDPANSAHVRIFFPTTEIPFAGHPTIGCALHLAAQSGASEIRLEEEAGLVPVTINDGRAEFTAPIPPRLTDAKVDRSLLAQALDLAPVDLASTTPRVGTGGPAFLFTQLSGPDALARARPIEPHWSALMTECGIDSGYLYITEAGGYRARMFSPTAGIPEDPATGSASAILMAHLLETTGLPEGESRFQLRQGIEMGRPSQIDVTARVTGKDLVSVRVAGHAVPIATGAIVSPAT
ncbi:PhzF family phenazine biosynthesis protein [Aestuariibius insulae]|uniref:PhzF family phenazine biosynthesis protein n=1 Tax=Aestuariibius insulae TaxID=2058287 RepID=UPI00345E9C7E